MPEPGGEARPASGGQLPAGSREPAGTEPGAPRSQLSAEAQPAARARRGRRFLTAFEGHVERGRACCSTHTSYDTCLVIYFIFFYIPSGFQTTPPPTPLLLLLRVAFPPSNPTIKTQPIWLGAQARFLWELDSFVFQRLSSLPSRWLR